MVTGCCCGALFPDTRIRTPVAGLDREVILRQRYQKLAGLFLVHVMTGKEKETLKGLYVVILSVGSPRGVNNRDEDQLPLKSCD